ncbi:uncharacterized protein EDB91DRAFT_1051468 [Suillus paluster]|uniref:uncharacterized protein n=1 Tax=Suillus paluster TaxID=48578 RepID=UPI001B862386|nr:uncharacterized protein EDB91DRAFT_1051468 [Suillus paluster]KAG1743284.1 hypothetical protein EDB91DRAFT_1051468 [Suillus paluster]
MLVFAIEYQLAIDSVTADKSANLRKFELDKNEWIIAGQLHSTLKIFKDATLFFSCSTPSLVTVIPAMDHIDEMLTHHSLNHDYQLSICAALGIAKKTLNHYYNATDQSEVYCIAMGTKSFSFRMVIYY